MSSQINWTDIINCNSNSFSSIISSYLTYNIETNIKNINDYKKHVNNMKIVKKFNILFRKGRLQRNQYLKSMFGIISNCFVLENGDLFQMSNNDNIKLHLMNLRLERSSMASEIRNRFNFTSFLQFFEVYVIEDFINQKRLNFILH